MARIIPFAPTDSLTAILELEPPAFSRADPFRQLRYIADYVRSLECRSLVIEDHYVDRDFIEDYSLFYSRNLQAYPNFCQRVHFFRCESDQTEAELHRLLTDLRKYPAEFKERAAEFSRDRYLGFTVIKPLKGSPVGRTVLSRYPAQPADLPDQERHFSGTRSYTVHLGPVTLSVTGLAFQQQDVGVSACATTALWSALHKVRDFEEIGAPTPAQITTLATRYSLPFGRPIPSDEGLSLDQMCQALQALQVAPHVLHAQRFRTGRSFVYSALRSEFAPVLLVSSETNPEVRHAVTAVGQRLAPFKSPVTPNPVDASERVVAFYVNDDRMGPYVRMNLIERNNRVVLETVRNGNPLDRWLLDFVLLPLHPKIRLPLSGLREIAIRFLRDLYDLQIPLEGPIQYEHWFARTPTYLRELMIDNDESALGVMKRIGEILKLPRYVGIARITTGTGKIDLLVDSTSTMKNLHCLAVVAIVSKPIDCSELARRYRCEYITSQGG